jgi:hypothetical protein
MYGSQQPLRCRFLSHATVTSNYTAAKRLLSQNAGFAEGNKNIGNIRIWKSEQEFIKFMSLTIIHELNSTRNEASLRHP